MNTASKAAGEVRGYLALAGVSVLGLIGGLWAVIAPFATGWPFQNGSWTHPMWAIVIPGVVLTAVSAVAAVLTTGLAARWAARARELAAEELE